jgi:MMP endo-(1,4)-3-O-methyl-alpha-D-mannosidase
VPPDLPGVLSRVEAVETGHAIASVQRPDGGIPWEDGRHADAWNHVEAAMALDVAGLHDAAGRAYRWLARTQRADGSWAATHRDGRPEDDATDANFCAYAATGIWHHFLSGGDCDVLREQWPVLESAIECVLTLQQPGGEVWWARDAAGRPWPGALLSSCSSICKSLECAAAAATTLGLSRRRWREARRALAAAVAGRPEAFEPKERWAMDWYYPVLGGAVRGGAADARLAGRWRTFVVEGLGVRCVSDRPWVTVAESCELVLTLDAIGRRAEALRMLGWLAPLRGRDGHYWTGVTFPEAELWPDERPTWTSAAVLLAADALCAGSRTSGLFKHAERALGQHLVELPRGQRPPEDMEGRLAALRRAAEDVVDGEEAASA